MWKGKVFIFCIATFTLHYVEGENNTNTSTVTSKDLAINAPLVDETEVYPMSEAVETTSDNSVRNVETTTKEILKKLPQRIVNGTRAVPAQFPQQVSLRRRYSQSHFCGGSVLTAEWILTAGHCTLDNEKQELKPYTILVVAGEIVLKNVNYARQWSRVENISVHPDFDYETLHNDIALLKLSRPFTMDMYVKPMAVAPISMRPGTVCQVSGWGYQKFEEHVVSSYLMYADIPIMSVSLCRRLLVNYTSLPTGMFCAGYLNGGRDACQGDSGGGMLCKGFLTGVVSGGEGCAWPRLPGLYTDVKVYVPWIKQHVNLTQNVVSVKSANRSSDSSALSSSLFALLLVIPYVLYTSLIAEFRENSECKNIYQAGLK